MFVDMHHHFVYGIDDGAQTLEDMKKMLFLAFRDGAERIVATPHATPGREPFPTDRFHGHFAEAQALCEEKNYSLQLYKGCEIFYTDDTVRLLRDGVIPTIGGSRYVLVEFSPEDPYDRLRQAARTLGSVGYKPIFAHFERYECLRKMANLEELHEEYQIIMQMNAATVAYAGFFARQWLRKVMRMGFVDLISSDAHNLKSRRFCMNECYEALKREYGKKAALELCRDNAMEILETCHPG